MKKFEYLEEYHRILSPEFPDFLEKYLALPLLVRLKKVGLLCGTDWTPLYSNRFFYSRFDHSLGCALIAWNLTRDKMKTLACLFHDVSTPCFSHSNDFRKGDALTQEATEEDNANMILSDTELAGLLAQDGLLPHDISDYHRFSVCDNKIPRLSCDRLEYMFPSGMALDESWDIESTRRIYSKICMLKNESGDDEIGFSDISSAAEYVKRCLSVFTLLQKNENKIALNLLGDIVNLALEKRLIAERDLFEKGEKELIGLFEKSEDREFRKFFMTFTTMRNVIRSDRKLDGCYCVNLEVKKRYIDPLVRTDGGLLRASEADPSVKTAIMDFLAFRDSEYGCVEFWNPPEN